MGENVKKRLDKEFVTFVSLKVDHFVQEAARMYIYYRPGDTLPVDRKELFLKMASEAFDRALHDFMTFSEALKPQTATVDLNGIAVKVARLDTGVYSFDVASEADDEKEPKGVEATEKTP